MLPPQALRLLLLALPLRHLPQLPHLLPPSKQPFQTLCCAA